LCLFFFSSRRRHTRFSRDWSSDVCSSDLSFLGRCFEILEDELCGKSREKNEFYMNCISHLSRHNYLTTTQIRECDTSSDEERKRSEERRVGKEGEAGGGSRDVTGNTAKQD